MSIVEIIRSDGDQWVKLPEGFHLDGNSVSIRRLGDSIVLEPLKPSAWPPGFFDQIHVDDPRFERPSQDQVPPAPTILVQVP